MEACAHQGKQHGQLRPLQTRQPCLLAAAGGIEVPAVMESKSTYVRAGIGGLHGRALQKEDELNIGEMSALSQTILSRLSSQLGKQGFAAPKWSVSRSRFLPLKKNPVIRVLEGKQFAFFTEESKRVFIKKNFVSRRSLTVWATGSKENRSN